jgi:hypothetical protein
LNNGEVLHDADETVESVYFPNSAIVSLIAEDASGQSVEVGLVGFEGVVGVSAVLFVEKSPFRALVQFPSNGLRMDVH